MAFKNHVEKTFVVNERGKYVQMQNTGLDNAIGFRGRGFGQCLMKIAVSKTHQCEAGTLIDLR